MRSALTALILASAILTTASCGANASTTTAPSQTSAAPVARLLIPTEGAFPFGIRNQTALAFDASTSTGMGLKYRIEFGDGEETAKIIDYHVGASNGLRTARLTVTDQFGRTSAAEVQYATLSLDTGWSQYWVAPGTTAGIFSVYDNGSSGKYWNGFRANGDGMGGTWTVSGRDIVLAATGSGPSMTGRVEWAPESPYASGACQPGQPSSINVSCLQMRLRIAGGPYDGQTIVYRFYDGS